MAAGHLYSDWNQSGVLRSERILEVRNVRGVDNFLVVGGLNVWRAKRAEKF